MKNNFKIVKIIKYLIIFVISYYILYNVFYITLNYIFIDIFNECIIDEYWVDCYSPVIKSSFLSLVISFILSIFLLFYINHRNIIFKN